MTEKRCTICNEIRAVRFFTKTNFGSGYKGCCKLCDFIPLMIRNAEARTMKREVELGRKMEPVSVTVEMLEQMTTCAISGRPVLFHPGVPNMASLDRIDDDKGYTILNSRIVNLRFNTPVKWSIEKFRQAFGVGHQQFIKARLVEVSKMKKNPHVGCGHNSKTKEYQRLWGNSQQSFFTRIASSANKWNRAKVAKIIEAGETPPSDIPRIEPDDIQKMWISQNGLCGYSGIPMGWRSNTDWRMSKERKNRGFYTLDNMVLVCQEFNSTEYITELFEDLFDGDVQGWNPDVVEDYRETERNKN